MEDVDLLRNMENNDQQLPSCDICLGSSDSNYIKYNLVVSGVILPIVGLIGIIGNFLVMAVYGSAEQRTNSTNIYLAALALSDFCMIWTAIILYGLEAWRHHGPSVLATIYGRSAQFVFPISTVLQTTSVYFCVAAAADCFVRIVLSAKIKDKYMVDRNFVFYYCIVSNCCTETFAELEMEIRKSDPVPSIIYFKAK
uniref:G-protein coupled receptors family 1 profile domain-containing protein n=1 Tax=Setaria digitata TaxID=48799 RepID=A0A915PN08_9BILA